MEKAAYCWGLHKKKKKEEKRKKKVRSLEKNKKFVTSLGS